MMYPADQQPAVVITLLPGARWAALAILVAIAVCVGALIKEKLR